MRERTTRYVLLGVLLQRQAASGYECQRHIAASIGHFWNESFGQIYPELSAMAAEGLIVPVGKADAGARARQRYRVTPRGRAKLREWLAKPATAQPLRQEALLKIFFGAIAGGKTVSAHLEREARLHTERLHAFNAIADVVTSEHADDTDLAFSLMVIRAGQVNEAARLRWVRECQRLLVAADRGNRALIGVFRRLPPLEENVP